MDEEFRREEEGGRWVGDIYIPPPPRPPMAAGDERRLVITHIVNRDFKSYAGVRRLGPFHHSFTAVVGPNGSGKSNVIDSMLFVFGYRASKIRSKKISVLIHSSNKHPDVKSCEVAVHFALSDGEGGVVPDTETVVSRTAFKDNSSHYTLDGKRATFKQVADLLVSKGIDLDHNRFLILQGEVEQIAMMKPKGSGDQDAGMLEYLEDIVGTSRFKAPLEKLFVRVEELSELRKEKLNRVRLVEAEKRELEEPKNDALERLDRLNALTRSKNSLLQKRSHSAAHSMLKAQEDRELRRTALAELDERSALLKTEKGDKSRELAERNEKYETIERDKERLDDAFKKLKTEDVALQADFAQMTKRKKNIEGVLEPERGKLIEYAQVPEKNDKDIVECRELSGRLEKQKAGFEAEIQKAMETVRTETQGLHEQKDLIQSDLIRLRKNTDEAKKNYVLAQSELKLYTSQEDKEKQKLTEFKETLESNESSVREQKKKLMEIDEAVPKKESALKNLRKEHASLKEEENVTSDKIRKLRNQLEESKMSMNANRSSSRLLEALMAQKRDGHLPGIYGRLGDLGGIDEKYDVAISTCCGALDNIVVDTAATAQECIEHLKRHDLGRATFIVAEKQEHLRRYFDVARPFPENAPRLFDLVRCSDDRVKPVFYYALRDTLVAKDMEQALRVSFNGNTRYRVVTLGGEVCEIVGTMSGGGQRTIRGRIGRSAQIEEEVDPKILKSQEQELLKLSERLKTIQPRIAELDKQISSLTRECAELKLQREKLDMEHKSLIKQIPTLKNKIKEQTTKASKSTVDPKQKSTLEKKTKDLELFYEKAQLDAREVEKKVEAIQEKIVQVGGGKLKSLQDKVDDIDKRLDKLTNEVTRLNVATKTSERNANKSKQKIDQMEKEIKDLEEKLVNIKQRKKNITLEGAEIEEKLRKIEEILSGKNEEFSELKQEIAKLTAEENKLKGERLEMVSGLSKFDKTIDEFKSKINSWKRELKSLTLETVEVSGFEPPEPLAEHTEEELEGFKTEDLQNKVHILEERLGNQKPNLQAIIDYKAKEALYLQRANELDEITNQRNEARMAHDTTRKLRHTEFLAGFNTITAKLKEMYQMITLGGDAELELVDSLDPFTEGIVFSVRPPNKSWKTISNLSGGEKTLSSLALVFALHYYKPTPLYVMDEIDAALDFKNVSIVANYIKERTKNAQFIIISLRYNMFELANRLVGIYKVEDCTNSLTIENSPALTDATNHQDAIK